MAPVDLMKVSTEELAKFLDSFDHVISDCDGELLILLVIRLVCVCACNVALNESRQRDAVSISFVSRNDGVVFCFRKTVDIYYENIS